MIPFRYLEAESLQRLGFSARNIRLGSGSYVASGHHDHHGSETPLDQDHLGIMELMYPQPE